MLTKSRILAGLQCDRRLHLLVHQPALADPLAGCAAIQFGNELGKRARERFPGGRLIGHVDNRDAARLETAEAIAAEPGRTLFEAAFDAGGVFLRVDVLRPGERGYDLIEVKASTKVKAYHLDDFAVQSWVLEQAGLRVDRILVARVDPDWSYGGDGDYAGLLALEDVTDLARARWSAVPAWVARFAAVLRSPEPVVETGRQCGDPFECGFKAHYGSGLPEYPLSILHRAREPLLAALRKADYADVREVPEAGLANSLHRRIREASRTGQPFLDWEAIASLPGLPWPRYYLDFETIQFVVPRWAGTRPYRQVPFQFSCHVEHADGRFEHLAFLFREDADPREAFAQALIRAVGDQGAILVYNQGFEQDRIAELAEDLPGLAAPLRRINARLVDLLPMTRKAYYHPRMMGSWSIKKVLPTIAPDLDYANLEAVQDGGEAARAFAEILDAGTAQARRAYLEERLLEYCARDTLAMVRLAHVLEGRDARVAA